MHIWHHHHPEHNIILQIMVGSTGVYQVVGLYVLIVLEL